MLSGKNGAAASVSKKNRWYYFKQNLPLTLLAFPTIVVFFIFRYIPLYGLILPFKDFKVSLGLFASRWCGIENFRFLFGGSSILIPLRNTLLYNLVFIAGGLVIAVVVALMLFELSPKQVKFFQTAYLIPYFISWVVAAYAFNAFLDMDSGVVNSVLRKLGMKTVMWYNEPKVWPPILIFACFWKSSGYSALVYYAALMGVDKELYEAATIDGAGKFKQIIHISIPMIKSMIVMMTILNIGNIFYSDFGLFYNVPLNSTLLYSTTDVIDTFVYRALTGTGDIGMSSAACFLQSMVGFACVVLANWCVRKIDNDNALF